METVTQWRCPQQIELKSRLAGRREALPAVSVMIARAKGLGAPPVYRALWRREMAGSTGVGNGLAIPHARITGIERASHGLPANEGPAELCGPGWQAGIRALRILVPAEGARTEHLQLVAMVAEAFWTASSTRVSPRHRTARSPVRVFARGSTTAGWARPVDP